MVRDRTAASPASWVPSPDFRPRPSLARPLGIGAALALAAALGCGESPSTPTAPATVSTAAALAPVGSLKPYFLPTPTAEDSYAFGINFSGQVVGYYRDANGVDAHAVEWTSDGSYHDLAPISGATSTSAGAINAAGDIVGLSYSAAQGYGGVLWTHDGAVVDFGANFLPVDIDDKGEVAGRLKTEGGTSHPAIWKDGAFHDLGLPAGMQQGAAGAINRFGDVVASVSIGPLDSRIAVWDTRSGWRVVDTQHEISGVAIDKRGDLLGLDADLPYRPRAMLWPRGESPVDLGSLSGPGGYAIPRGMNDFSVVVGETTTPVAAHNAAFRWSGAMGMEALIIGAGSSASASAINDRGEIVGQIYGETGARAVLWTTRPASALLADVGRASDGTGTTAAPPARARRGSPALSMARRTQRCLARPYDWLPPTSGTAVGDPAFTPAACP